MEFGLLMNSGRPIGTGSPFGFYPLYPVRARLRALVIGDDAGAISPRQHHLRRLDAPVALVHRLAPPARSACRGRRVGVRGIPLSACLRYTADAFTDNLFLPMFFAAMASLVWAVRARAVVPGILAGIVCALGAETRPSLLTLFPILLPMLLFGLRDWTWQQRGRRSRC